MLDEDPLFEEIYCQMYRHIPKKKCIWIATWGFSKDYSDQHIQESDYVYGYDESDRYEVFTYLCEIRQIGKEQFYEKYKNYVLY